MVLADRIYDPGRRTFYLTALLKEPFLMLSISQIRPSGPRRMPILHGCVLSGACPKWEFNHAVEPTRGRYERRGDSPPPKSLNRFGASLRVAHGMLDIAVPKPRLRARVRAPCSPTRNRSRAQHCGMDREGCAAPPPSSDEGMDRSSAPPPAIGRRALGTTRAG